MEVSRKKRNRIIGFTLMFFNFMLVRYLLSRYLQNYSISLKDGLITSFCYLIAYIIFGYIEDKFIKE